MKLFPTSLSDGKQTIWKIIILIHQQFSIFIAALTFRQTGVSLIYFGKQNCSLTDLTLTINDIFSLILQKIKT